MDECERNAILYLAMLRAISIVHQNNHWVTSGSNFYSNHQLFERLYNSAVENLDDAAEKFIGLMGPEFLDANYHNTLLGKILDKYSTDNGIEQSLKIEEDFLNFSEDIYHLFGKENMLSLGLDDMIMSIASDREKAVYLLKQSRGKL